ncbi:MAG: Mesaconyl-C(4)-CoA hydratase [Alphaproteobacteria bacterium MarineAlpha10_Bin2]|nr:MAG: Mesaconyl-C(4)-CoA hydratase [Alphaproteobacteria bacterium MarineAlpha10_Bin2]
MDAQTESKFDDWIGNAREQRERIDTALTAGMSAALDRDDAPTKDGDPLPPCWHWMFFRDATVQSKLGTDGLPARGALMPPVPLPRRMWAASQIRFLAPLRLGEMALKRSEIASITEKSGKSGRLVFVNLRHTVLNAADEVAIEEEQNIVYTEAPKSGAMPPPRPAPEEAAWRRELRPDPVMLFRYSALTFNPHRIHYDQPYCTQEEGYPGLVVHGPLIATLMVDLCRRSRPDAEIKEFSFRALSPLFVDHAMTLGGAPSDEGSSAAVWAANDQGGLASQGEVKFA